MFLSYICTRSPTQKMMWWDQKPLAGICYEEY